MKRFYKYYSLDKDRKKNLLSSLEQSYFWLTDPTDLNDPFEAYVEYYTSATNEEKIEWAKRRKLINPRNNNISNEDCCRVAEWAIKYQKEKKNEYELKERKSFGICSFTTKPKNFLMWSHYGDSHKGICLGYESSEENDDFILPLKNNLRIPLYKVKYQKFSSRYDFLKEDPFEYKKCIFEKHPNWSYENEFRLVMVNGKYIDDSQLRKTYYQKSCLKEIIFGCKTNESDIQEILTKIKQLNIEPEKIRKLKLNPKSMQLIYDPDFKI